MDILRKLDKLKGVIRSQRGRDILVFCIFLLIATVLWMILALNEETQHDVRMPVHITHVPDSVTIISTPPATVSVSMRAKGTQVFKQAFGHHTSLDIDFRIFANRNSLILTETDVKGLIRQAFGGANVLVATPDSINLAYTTRKGIPLPIKVDYKLTTGPQSIPDGKPTLSIDTVLLYQRSRYNGSIRYISTEPISVADINRQTTIRAKLIVPPNTRIIPDSVDVTFNVEPLISKSRKVPIETVNVPEGIRLITFPPQIMVHYMVPMSEYNDSDPHFRVLANYNTIEFSQNTRKIKVTLRDVPADLYNVHLAQDSVEYVLERK